MKLHDIMQQIETFENREFYGPVDEGIIHSSEMELNIVFPSQYVEFLGVYGAGSISSESFIGLGGPKHLDIVWLTKTLRSKKGKRSFPYYLLPIRSDGYGNYDCIDLSLPTSGGEYSIVEWIHDGSDEEKGRILAGSYYEWMMAILDMIREID